MNNEMEARSSETQKTQQHAEPTWGRAVGFCRLIAAFVMIAVQGGCAPQSATPVSHVVNNAKQTPAASSEAVVSSVPDSVVPDTAKSASADHKRIQGTWDYVTLTTGPRDSIVFSQDKITFHVRDKTVAGTFVLDSTTQPKRIELLFAGEPDGADARLGIYQFQDDLLVICLGTTAGVRPTEFQKGEKQNHIMLVRPTH